MTSTKRTIYIAGPMTGLTDFNLNSFNVAEEVLRSQGHEVRNPACLGHGWANYEDYMEIDLVMLGQCDSIVFLPGSGKSPGAQREAQRARELDITSCNALISDAWRLLESLYHSNGGKL